MADLTVDPIQMKMAADAVLRISEQVRSKITDVQRALESSPTWQGATRRATVEQFAQQMPVLTKLSGALERGSTTLQTAGFGFTDHDETGAQGVGSAGAAAAGQAAAPQGGGSSLASSLNY